MLEQNEHLDDSVNAQADQSGCTQSEQTPKNSRQLGEQTANILLDILKPFGMRLLHRGLYNL